MKKDQAGLLTPDIEDIPVEEDPQTGWLFDPDFRKDDRNVSGSPFYVRKTF